MTLHDLTWLCMTWHDLAFNCTLRTKRIGVCWHRKGRPCSLEELHRPALQHHSPCHKGMIETNATNNQQLSLNTWTVLPVYVHYSSSTVFTLKLTSEVEIFPWQAGDPSRVHISSSLGGRGCTCQGNRLGKCPERMEASPAVFLHHPAWQLRTSAQILSNIRPCTVT